MNTPDTNSPGRRAAALLWRAARPESRHLWIGLAWLAVAAALDALGPVLGKAFIDRYLLPRDPAMASIAAIMMKPMISGLISATALSVQHADSSAARKCPAR